MSRSVIWSLVGLAVFAAVGSNASSQSESSVQRESGVYVRLVTVRVDPADGRAWEAAVRLISDAARRSGIESCCDWLLYSEGEFTYHVVLFSEGLEDLDTPESFARAFEGTVGEPAFRQGVRELQETRYEVTSDLVHEMVADWSTVEGMSTATHPKARLTKYWVRPGAEKAFDEVMRERAEFFKAIDYPYPVEGFRWRVGSPGMNYVNVFPDTWVGFFGKNNPRSVARRRGREEDYDSLIERLTSSVLRIEYHDIDFEVSLSY